MVSTTLLKDGTGDKSSPEKSHSPIPFDTQELEDLVKQEMFQAQLSLSAQSVDRDTALGTIRENVYHKNKLELQLRSLIVKNTILKAKNEKLSEQLTEANNKINTLPFFELKEKEIIPTYLLNANYVTREEQWYLSFFYKVTTFSRVLRERVPEDFEVRKLSRAIMSLFKGLSENVSHKEDAIRLNLTEKYWQYVFEVANITDEIDQRIIKEVFRPVLQSEIDNVDVDGNFFLHASALDLNFKDNTEDDEINKIKKKCGDLAHLMKNFYFPVNYTSEYTNDLFVEINSNDEVVITTVMERLKLLGLNPKNTKVRKCRIFAHKSRNQRNVNPPDRSPISENRTYQSTPPSSRSAQNYVPSNRSESSGTYTQSYQNYSQSDQSHYSLNYDRSQRTYDDTNRSQHSLYGRPQRTYENTNRSQYPLNYHQRHQPEYDYQQLNQGQNSRNFCQSHQQQQQFARGRRGHHQARTDGSSDAQYERDRNYRTSSFRDRSPR
ncbi:uncharacterized protein LOC135845393 [Planococcus citri]|uniref:uncharacterized protein LOC135845393 n=1 Tax=Planococcus citri TaxID=170843 RepID=UPI0031FA0AF9